MVHYFISPGLAKHRGGQTVSEGEKTMQTEENDLWHLSNVSSEAAYQLGLTVASMVNAALQEVISQASAESVTSFHSGIISGLRQAGLDITDITWPQEYNGKKRITAMKATNSDDNQRKSVLSGAAKLNNGNSGDDAQ